MPKSPRPAPAIAIAIAETTAADKPTVALALGAGGAKGLAPIGVIEEIEAQGFEIVAIAGSSMGALIGGIHAMGKLDVYRDWVGALARFDVLRLLDWTFSGGGLIKGERIIDTLRSLIGDIRIEELPLAFTAVATDLDLEREVWLTRGRLFDAIRASIAVPTVFRLHRLDGRRLVDGGLLNPVPVSPLIGARADFLLAVSIDGPSEAAIPVEPVTREPVDEGSYRQRIGEFITRLAGRRKPAAHARHAGYADPGDGFDAGQPGATAAGRVPTGPADRVAAQHRQRLRVLPRPRADRTGTPAGTCSTGRLAEVDRPDAFALNEPRAGQHGPWVRSQFSRYALSATALLCSSSRAA